MSQENDAGNSGEHNFGYNHCEDDGDVDRESPFKRNLGAVPGPEFKAPIFRSIVKPPVASTFDSVRELELLALN
jgi:hypothetical protein